MYLSRPTSGFVLSGAVEILSTLDELDVDRESWLAGWKACSRGDCIIDRELFFITANEEILGFVYYHTIHTFNILTILDYYEVDRESWAGGWKACSRDDGMIDREGIHDLVYFLAMLNDLNESLENPQMLGIFELPKEQ
jgi:hypothetical protein